MEDEPKPDFAFEIQGPDDNGHVWICSAAGRDVWCENLGPANDAAETMRKWLGQRLQQELDSTLS